MSERHPVFALLQSKKGALTGAVPKTMRAGLTWEAIVQGVGLAMEKNSTLVKCHPQTIYTSLLTILRLGLDPSGLTQQAYLVPFYNSRAKRHECQAIIGQQGKIELAYRSGQIDRIITAVIYENDDCEFNLADGTLSHTFDLRGDDRGGIVAAYARVWIRGSAHPVTELMTYAEFGKIKAAAARRNRDKLSPAYREWEGEMFRRSVLNRALKRCPKSADLAEVLQREAEITAQRRSGDIIDVDDIDLGSEDVRPLHRGQTFVPDPQALEDHADRDAIVAEGTRQATEQQREPVPVRGEPQGQQAAGEGEFEGMA